MNPFRPLSLLPLLALAACAPQPSNVENAAAQATGAEAAPAAGGFPDPLLVAGTEPFWSVKVEGEVLEYTTPETMESPRRLQATRQVDGAGLHLSGQDDEEVFALDVRREPCSDGMSDYEYPYAAEFVLGTRMLKGCARDPAVDMPPL